MANPHPFTPYLYVCLQVGAERALKEELALTHPELRFAYSRPGFVTFKTSKPAGLPPDFELNSVFARTWGFSIGAQKSLADAAAATQSLAASLGVGTLGLHVWEKDEHTVGEEPLGFVAGTTVEPARARFSGLAGELLDADSSKHEWILDLMTSIGTEEVWLGFHHRKMGSRSRCSNQPGGAIPVQMPEDSPSRAFIKLEQALHWSGLSPKAGEHALEIGSAPGGAAYALLLRDLKLTGIDPGLMDPMLRTRFPGRLRHIKTSVSQVSLRDLPEAIDWLVLDINAKPRVTLTLVADLLKHAETAFLPLKGMVLTLKINDWKLARFIPEWVEYIGELAAPFGLTQVRATQLPANKQEICVVARRRPVVQGLTRPLTR